MTITAAMTAAVTGLSVGAWLPPVQAMASLIGDWLWGMGGSSGTGCTGPGGCFPVVF